jgi:ABC-2 type transport system ATP-binding protein
MTGEVQVSGLVKAYGDVVALAGVDLVVERGCTVGILGPNGAGKTTLVRILTTLAHPDGGTARVCGHDVVRDAAAVRRSIGVTGQHVALDDVLTGRENLRMVGELAGLGRAARVRADELLERFGLVDAANRRVGTYSGGMRRRVDLAASLVTEPPVLFLDEPTTGLDPHSRAGVWAEVRRLVAAGTTLVLTTQYLEEADQLADRVAVMLAGRVVAEETPTRLKAAFGADRLEITLAPGASMGDAVRVVGPYATGAIRADAASRALEATVAADAGLTTLVVRALDDAGVAVDRLVVRSPSLDEVFLGITGAPGTIGAAA